MIMIVLQHLCGLKVRTFILKEKKGEKAVYFLISQSIDNLMKLASRYKIKKEVKMSYIDFHLNDPLDKYERPLKYHTSLKESPDFRILHQEIKAFCRKINIKSNNLNR